MSVAVRKFGTFAGVYTPSVLTILGVIMYLRMGYVVGNAGMWNTIAIILVAHVISITTGLSVASISTDRKIEAGGIYYILSRSLGLPIGGAIGFTLFVGTALAISLYLVGFSESFIDVTAPIEANWLGLSDLSMIRIVASSALVLITIIAFISTNIALKLQFVILGAIVLSLISIFGGDWSNPDPINPELLEIKKESEWFNLFAIFFPAVTGFTAGVAMSGDLKDPKKSIPNGTILSIASGLIIYLFLAVFIAVSIPQDLLITDDNVLKKYAWIPVLVVAGIWGATLSSAIGSLLGAPRILQAMSMDKIGPKIFARGFGAENEPRNALILTFLIAEAGILIGELNTIAEIVSMFFLAAYGFINLAQFLESWASTDYLPSFKISKWFGLVGFIATLYVMMMLNTAAMIIALIVILGIFVFLTRKQITLGSGDVWQSVWSSVVKAGLKRMDRKEMHKRNWEPNILLFSGETDNRPYLLEFSKALAGRLGMISNFDLVETPDSKVLFPKHQQAKRDTEIIEQGVFSRRQECKNLFQGIEMISATYGFSGIEPNTVLMGWARNASDPILFSQMNKRLIDLDYNILYLDFNQKKGFGNYTRIDLWWDGFSKDCEFMLSLVKLIQTSNQWRNAQVRVLMVNSQNDQKIAVEEQIAELIVDLRIQAEIEVVNNAIDKKTFYDIVKAHSFDSDLIFLPIPELALGSEKEFVNTIDELVDNIGTTVLVRASSHFDEIAIDLNTIHAFNQESEEQAPYVLQQKITFDGCKSKSVQTTAEKLYADFREVNGKYANNGLKGFQNVYKGKIDYLQGQLALLLMEFDGTNEALKQKIEDILRKVIDEISRKQLINAAQSIRMNSVKLIDQHRSILDRQKSRIEHVFSREDLLPEPNEEFRISRAKKLKRTVAKIGIKPKIKIRFRALSVNRYDYYFIPKFKALKKSFSLSGYQVIEDLTTIFQELNDTIDELPLYPSKQVLKKVNLELQDRFALFFSDLNKYPELIRHELDVLTSSYVNKLIQDANRVDVNTRLEERIENRSVSRLKTDLNSIERYADSWLFFQNLLHNNLLLEQQLSAIKCKVKPVVEGSTIKLTHGIFWSLKKDFSDFENQLNVLQSSNNTTDGIELNFKSTTFFTYEEIIKDNLKVILDMVKDIPESLFVIDTQQIDLERGNFHEINKSNIKAKELVVFMLESKLVEDIELKTLSIIEEVQKLKVATETSGKLVAYTCQNPEVKPEQLKEVVSKAQADLTSTIARVQALEQKLTTEIRSNLIHVNEMLVAKTFIARANQLGRYVKRDITKKGMRNYITPISTGIEKIYKRLASRYLSTREDFVQAQFRIANESIHNLHAEVHDFIELISISSEVEEVLPFYYKQLFLGRHALLDELLMEKSHEHSQLKQAFKRSEQGVDGAILITGCLGSGYSSTAEIWASKIESSSFYEIKAPSRVELLNEKSWDNAMFESANVQNWPEYKTKLEPGDTLFFKDIELWFVKGTSNLVFEKFLEFIRTYGGKLNIYISCNIEFYKYVRKVTALDNVLHSSIIIAPRSAEIAMKELMYRHNSGGMKLMIGEKFLTQLPKRQQNKIIKKFHQRSNGTIGSVLYLWLANIVAVKGDTLYMEEPAITTNPVITNPDWLVLLNEFLIHKEMTAETAIEIFKSQEKAVIRRSFTSLLRTGLLKERNEMYAINPYAEMYVEEILRENGLIS